MRRVLFFANDFPPIGGAGVQRPFYFTKYLAEIGWIPEVVTVKDVVFPVKDETLLRQLPGDVSIHRTESGELRRLLFHVRRLLRSGPQGAATGQDHAASRANTRDLGRLVRKWVFVPDDRVLWVPFAVARAMRIAREKNVDVILATAPCYSACVAGHLASRILKIPLVLDLRDPWTRDPYMQMPTVFHAWWNRRLEKSAVLASKRVVVISQQMAVALGHDYPAAAHRIRVITNGFDRRDFDRIEPMQREGGFAITYSGSLYAHHLDAVRAFAAAWRIASDRDDGFRRDARLVVVGRVDPEIRDHLEESGIPFRAIGYVSHDEAVGWLKGASALFLAIRELDPSKDVITIPGKLFEYLAAGKPIVMVGPAGDAATLVERTGGRVHREAEVEGISESLADAYHGRLGVSPEQRSLVEAFDRFRLTESLGECLEEASREGMK